MKKLLMLSLATAVFSAPALAEHGPDGAPHHKKGEWFQKVDANGDGMISKAEFMAKHEERFNESDANKDGQISKEEAAAQKEKWAEKMKEKRAERQKMKEQMKEEAKQDAAE